jgi:hypothetical protein
MIVGARAVQRCTIALPLLFVFIAGCATVRIDVDVYKGPLANHEDVQVRQYVTLAVAARPVLISLRNRLEDQANLQFRALPEQQRRDFINAEWPFKNETARLINGALSFYGDSGDRRFANQIQAVSAAYDEVLIAYDQFVVNGNRDRALADALRARYPTQRFAPQTTDIGRANQRLYGFARLQARFLEGGGLSDDEEQLGCTSPSSDVRLDRLPAGVERRLAGELQCACKNLNTALSRLSPVDVTKTLNGGAPPTCAAAAFPEANESFTVMSDRSVVENYSTIFFGANNSEYVDA